MTTPTLPLLGYLAKFGSFSKQSELLCTQGLTYLLQKHEAARSVLAREVKARTSIGIGDSLKWLAEARQEDLARPDLEARTADGVPVVKIEAKLGADLYADQLQSYEADLRQRNASEAALLVLVPKGRTDGVAQVIVDAFGPSGSEPWRVTNGRKSGGVVIATISWDELFDALRSAQEERFRHELDQLEAMYRVLRDEFIAPLASIEDLRQWTERKADLINIVDEATRRLTTEHQTYPMGTELLEVDSHEDEPGEYRRRYVCSCTDNIESCYCIGVRHSFAEWVTPVWMRFRHDTGHFTRIRQRIEASSLDCLDSAGHIWIPMHIPINASGEEMIQAIVEQAQEVLRVAYPAD